MDKNVTCYMFHVTSYMLHVTLSYMLEMPCILFWVHLNIYHMSNCHMSHVTCHMSHVTYNMLLVTWRISHVTCCMSHAIHYMSLVMPSMYAVRSVFNLLSHFNLWHVTCHMSLVTFHMSQVICHISHVVFHMSLGMSCIVQSPWCWPNKMTMVNFLPQDPCLWVDQS